MIQAVSISYKQPVPQPFSLYAHIPYCQSKCPYCDFNSYASSWLPEAQYTDGLVAELEHYAVQPTWRGPVQTIFFGGGTPSLFAPAAIARVLATVDRLWPASSPIDPITEISLEANPGSVTLEKLRAFRALGVNRISFGVQSFQPQHLARLGRTHDWEEAVSAIGLARDADFENVGVDLMFAVPGQTLEDWETDLGTAVSLGPDHVSAYGLTFEEGTPFHVMRAKGQLREVPQEIEIAMFTRTREVLGAAGYIRYEISNYARPGRECRHNLNYWRRGGYLGIGAGAHSFAPMPGLGARWGNERNPASYISRVTEQGHARVSEEVLNASQAQGEFVFLGLRLRDGLDVVEFADHFGIDFKSAFPHAESLERDGLLVFEGSHLRLSDRGLLLADSVFATFV